MKMFVTSLVLVSALFFAVVTIAQDGILDPSFGEAGTVLPELPEYSRAYPNSITTRPDGRILVAGNAIFGPDVSGTPYDVYLLQYLPDGTPDPSFGSGGLIREQLSPFGDFVGDAIIQPDGKTVITGSFTRSIEENGDVNSNVFVIRYLATGVRDTSFGVDGLFSIQLSKARDMPRRIILQPDGKLVVGGDFLNNRSRESFALRLLPDGTLDPEFGEAGKMILRFLGESASSAVYALQLQPDGKLILAGERVSEPMVVRLLSDGARDSSFADKGVFYFNLDFPFANVEDFILYEDGRILAAVNTFEWDGPIARKRPLLMQVDPDGQLDEGFGTSGIRTFVQPDTALQVEQLQLQADGKLLLGGFLLAPTAAHEEAFLLRLLPDGSRDPSFGQHGLVLYRIGDNNHIGQAVTLQSDGKILLAGSTYESIIFNYMPFLARFENVQPLGVGAYGFPFSGVQVFPNPASSRFIVRFQLDRQERVTIQLYDMWGRVVTSLLKNETLFRGQFEQHFSFPGDLAAGSYMLRISTHKSIVNQMVLKH